VLTIKETTGMRTKLGAVLLSAALAVAGCTGGGTSPSSPAVGARPTSEGTPGVFIAAPTPTPTPTPGPPATTADLLTYIKAGSKVDLAAYDLEPLQPLTFASPTHNIKCAFDGGSVACGIDQHSWAPFPKPTGCPVDWDQSIVEASDTGVRRGNCSGNPAVYAFATKVLPYGSTISNGANTCRSESAFMACANLGTGNGFAIAREFYKVYGTVNS
jgi:hypothetical protein